MFYFMLELYPPALNGFFSEDAKLSKATILSTQFEHDIQAEIKLQEVIEALVPEEFHEEIYHEYNPMFFPDNANEETELVTEEIDVDFDLNDFSIYEKESETIFNTDVLMSSHYVIDQTFEHLELYGRVYVTAEKATCIDFESNITVH